MGFRNNFGMTKGVFGMTVFFSGLKFVLSDSFLNSVIKKNLFIDKFSFS